MARPQIPINWDQFDKLCNIHCTLIEIAEWFNCSEDTIERAVKREKGMGFAEYFKRKSGRGKISLRRKMFDTAMGGNVTMQIFLSKNMLGYRDKIEEIHVPPTQDNNITKISFEQFCDNVGYPRPYRKQIEMMEFGMNEEKPRLLLGARGYGKTDYVVILGIAYKLYLDPSYTTLIITKSEQRNSAMLQEISKALKENGVELEKENSGCLRIVGLLGKDHSVSAVTIGTTSLRGRHPKLVVMDDPVTDEDVSEATRLKVERVYNEVNKLCQNVLLIGQPVHKYDLYEKLRPVLKKMEVPHGSIPELDHDLEAMRLAGVDQKSIEASYLLRIISEDSNPFDKVKYIDQYPVGLPSVAFIDPSFEGGDYTAVTICRGLMGGVVVVGFAYQKAWNHAIADIREKFTKYNVHRLCFETNSLGEQPVEHLRRELPNVAVVGKKSLGCKHSRIMNAGTYSNMIHLAKDSHKTYIDQVVKYEYKAKYDDCPDSLASALEWIGYLRGK